MSAIKFEELLRYTQIEVSGWKEWFTAHPDALDLECDVAKTETLRGLLLHTFATALYFAHRVLDMPEPNWTAMKPVTVEELFAVGEEAHAKLAEFLAKASSQDWEEIRALPFRDLKVSKRKMVAQALLHGVHHRGQLATALRQKGHEGMWVHDLIVTDAMR